MVVAYRELCGSFVTERPQRWFPICDRDQPGNGAGFVVLANRLDDATSGAIQSVINALRTKIVTPSNPEPTTSVLASIGTNFNGSILTVTTPNQASDLKFNYDDTLNVLTVEAKVGNGSTLVRRYATDLIRELRINTAPAMIKLGLTPPAT